MNNKTAFVKELEHLINKYSMENGSDTPDFILAEYLTNCLDVFNTTLKRRETWYGREAKPLMTYLGEPPVAFKSSKNKERK